VVTGSGSIRDSALEAARSYSFEEAAIACHVRLCETDFNDLLNLWIPNKERGKVAEGYEMIPFVAKAKYSKGKKAPGATEVTVTLKGKAASPLTPAPVDADTIVVDRGGFGVRIELDQARKVQLGQNSTIMINLCQVPTPASKLELRYRLVPFLE
jgi:hypothetical protein